MKSVWILVFVMAVFCELTSAQSVTKMTADSLSVYIAKSERPLVVSFWATWCSSCNEEIPYFITTLKEKYKDAVDLVLVSLDVKAYYPAKIQYFAAKRHYQAQIIWLNEANADVFCPKIDPTWSGAIPSTLMVNNKSAYRKFYESGITQLQFEKDINALLGVEK